jgi:hypothetical protein
VTDKEGRIHTQGTDDGKGVASQGKRHSSRRHWKKPMEVTPEEYAT